FGQQFRSLAPDMIERKLAEDVKFGPQAMEDLLIGCLHPFAFGTDVMNLAKHFRQRNEALERRRTGRALRGCAIGQFLHPVVNAKGQRSSAHRAATAQPARLLRLASETTCPMAV